MFLYIDEGPGLTTSWEVLRKFGDFKVFQNFQKTISNKVARETVFITSCTTRDTFIATTWQRCILKRQIMRTFILPPSFFQLCTRGKKLAYLSRQVYYSQFAMEDRPVEKAMQDKLRSRLSPVHLKVVNESYMHNVPKGSETHFKVLVVSKEFENMSLINRHRLVNSILQEELASGVHALSIDAKAPSQWDHNEEIEPSPKCLGGFGK